MATTVAYSLGIDGTRKYLRFQKVWTVFYGHNNNNLKKTELPQ